MTPEQEQAAGERALAAYESMAVTWCAQHGMNAAVSGVLDAVASRMPGARERAQTILVGLIRQAHMEGAEEGYWAGREYLSRLLAGGIKDVPK